MDKWIFLSHLIKDSHFAYGDGKRINIQKTNRINNGDTSNNSFLKLPTHFSTHLDFPYHFSDRGMKGEQLAPEFFLSKKISVVYLNVDNVLNYLVSEKDFESIDLNPTTEILLLKTGMENFIDENEYWSQNPGFKPNLSSYLKNRMPNLRIFGFDSISLTGRKFRDQGKEAHKNFLLKENILILEDVHLSELNRKMIIKEIIISPLRFEEMDGAPVTIFAKINVK